MAVSAGGIGSALGSVIAGLSGAGSGAQGQANNDANQANQILQEIGNAPDVSAPLILQKYAQAGILTPAMEQNITAQLPANITTNPAYKQAQMQALTQMQQRANTGFTQADRAQLNQAQLGAEGQTQAQLASIQQNMQQQGLANSGTALASKLAAAQQGANQMSTNADQQAQIAQNAQQQAIGNLGNMASGLQNQDFGQQMAQQQAQQQMQRFNVQNQLGVQQANVNAQNQSQAANLANAQNVSNQNVGAQNSELNNQDQRALQQYGADVNTAKTKAGGYGALAGYNTGVGQNQAQAAQNLGSGLGGLAGTAAGAAFGAADGGKVPDFKHGGPVHAQNSNQKAVLPGDAPENDRIHAVLSEGEIVVPRTLSESKFGKHLLKIIEAHKALKDHINNEG